MGMGIARLLAKAWVVICCYAGALALNLALQGSSDPWGDAVSIGVALLLFLAMGLLFASGYGVLSGHVRLSKLRALYPSPSQFAPGFNETVFLGFVILSFVDQAFFAPSHLTGIVTEALERAIYFAVPGQRALADVAASCMLDGGRIFASAFSWFLALIYLCSALSRVGLTAGLIRLERSRNPEALGNGAAAVFISVVALVGIQFLYIGSGYYLLPCSLMEGLPGALIIGLAPLLLAYAVAATLAMLIACGKE
jgi:hypothetical protein